MLPLSWNALEFEEKDRHPDWIWYAGLVAVIVAAVSFFYGNIFFGIFALIAGANIIIYAFQKPKMLAITIKEEGIEVNDMLIDVRLIKQFWLDESDKQDKLLLLVRGGFVPKHSFSLDGVSADAVRSAMKALNVPELEIRSSNSEKIFDRLGF